MPMVVVLGGRHNTIKKLYYYGNMFFHFANLIYHENRLNDLSNTLYNSSIRGFLSTYYHFKIFLLVKFLHLFG